MSDASEAFGWSGQNKRKDRQPSRADNRRRIRETLASRALIKAAAILASRMQQRQISNQPAWPEEQAFFDDARCSEWAR